MDQSKSSHSKPNSETPCFGVFEWKAYHRANKVIAMRECPKCGVRQFGSKGAWITHAPNPTPGTDTLNWSPR